MPGRLLLPSDLSMAAIALSIIFSPPEAPGCTPSCKKQSFHCVFQSSATNGCADRSMRAPPPTVPASSVSKQKRRALPFLLQRETQLRNIAPSSARFAFANRCAQLPPIKTFAHDERANS